MAVPKLSALTKCLFVLLSVFVREAFSQSSDGNYSTKVALGVTFGMLAVLVIVVFGFFKVYGGMVRREPSFLNDRPDPDGVERNSVYLRWGVQLKKVESYAVKVRHYVLFFKNESHAGQTSPCTVLVPSKPDGSGDYTHQGVRKGDRLVFWVLAIYMSRLPLCGGMHESRGSKKVHFKGVSMHYDPNDVEEMHDESNWPMDTEAEERGPLTA